VEILRSISLYVEDRGMPFLVIGGHAINSYGISRQTGDLDLLVRKSDKAAWEELMSKLEYLPGQNDERFARYRPQSLAAWPIDFMFVDDQTFARMLSQAVEAQFGPARARIPSARHLATLKIHALKHYHEHRFARDFSDLVSLLRSGKTGIKEEDLRELCLKYADLSLFEKLKGALPKNGS